MLQNPELWGEERLFPAYKKEMMDGVHAHVSITISYARIQLGGKAEKYGEKKKKSEIKLRPTVIKINRIKPLT